MTHTDDADNAAGIQQMGRPMMPLQQQHLQLLPRGT
jgi:hypothetical protein